MAKGTIRTYSFGKGDTNGLNRGLGIGGGGGKRDYDSDDHISSRGKAPSSIPPQKPMRKPMRGLKDK